VSRSNTLTSSNGTSGSSSSALACPAPTRKAWALRHRVAEDDHLRGAARAGASAKAQRRGIRDHDDVERRRHGIVGTS
jgi:hypothetical protein